MDRKVDRRLHNIFQNSGNHNFTWDYGYCGRDTFLANSSSNNMGHYMFTMDSLYHDDRY
ncbi:hypothetical protein C1645_815466 [Glomus cerebriforme]|uniref:Uncharacterized protein n=1 Tax=Glomus cerebriforme TaxID=658196 RepID=A0A397TDX6_9GLOM|nr:hypothetical protein C1645_815466 [Glomus cerebriforme]